MIFNRLRIPISLKKTVGPTTQLQYLGIILDTDAMEGRLPLDKLDRIRGLLCQFGSKQSVSKRALLSLLGHLNFASRVIKPGRSFVSYLLALAASVKELHHHVRLNVECRLDLAMWLRFLTGWNGVALFLDKEVTKAADYALYTDASATMGYGGFFQNRWFQAGWPPELMLKDNKQLSMAFLELYPIVVSAMLWGSEWVGKKILFYCDNEATVHIINKGRSHAQPIMKLMRHLTSLLGVRREVISLSQQNISLGSTMTLLMHYLVSRSADSDVSHQVQHSNHVHVQHPLKSCGTR